ncbi:long-chain-fatty-acid--CoA ligase [Actinomadura sp. GC306]|uniref:long-chain-fatty-acid--CoA ligase n=1 Tax=Actinomadura sp. GC306 TaxID=2530367 RepID=UPI001053F1EE|nr:long-chain-fatty-acid--CoA ligase [Actinomadura sp. GC306]TDC68521.1 long-chain-fatty-acid--CoA ligase [Actinomadura sp. GC306]
MTASAAIHGARGQHWIAHLARHAHARPDVTALRCGDVSRTWRELAGRVPRSGRALARLGVGPGDRVAFVMGNGAEYVESLLAVTAAGAVGVPVNPRLAAAEVAYILRDCGAALVLADAAYGGLAADAAKEDGVRVVDVTAPDGPLGEDLLNGHTTGSPADELAAIEVDEHAPALIMYTSGTTGHPKGAVLTHRNLLAQSQTNLIAFRFEMYDEVYLCASPLFHIGAIGGLAPSLLAGATVVVMPTGAFDAGEHLDVMAEHRVTSVFLVPTQWQALVAEQRRRPRDLSRLRVAAWGAAPATDTLLREMSEVFGDADMLALFGQTEMSPVTCVLEGKDARRKLGSVGRPAPGVWARVVDREMNDVPAGEIGEIVYRGPGLMSGYWNLPEATAEAFAGGWFHSGDLVRVDDEGFVHVVDRLKDMVITGGENVYCAEVENVLASHPDIAEVAVVGRPHPKWGETPVAVVSPRPGRPVPSVEELRDHARRELAPYKLPTGVEAVERLPRNASGKVLKFELRDGRADDIVHG